MKKTLFAIVFLTIVCAFTITAFAEPNDNTVTIKGDAVFPYFQMSSGDVAFCIESDVIHPDDGAVYNFVETYENESILRLVKNYIAMKKTSEDVDLLNKVTQMAIWDIVDNTQCKRALVLRRLGEAGINTYDELINGTNELGDNEEISLYILAEESGNYQKLVSWTITVAVAPVTPDVEPEPAPIIPDVPDIPDVSDVPENPEPTDEEPAVPEDITDVPVEPDFEDEEPTVEPTPDISPEPTVEDDAPDVLPEMEFVTPKTGDSSAPILYIILALSALGGLMLLTCGRKKQ